MAKELPPQGSQDAQRLAHEMYEAYLGGESKSVIEERFLGSGRSHGKRFTRIIRRELGIETETRHPLAAEVEGLRKELGQLRLQLDLDSGTPAQRAAHRPRRQEAKPPSRGPMRRLYVDGMRSLVEASLEPFRLSCLIGANASGKSNVLSALQLLRDAVEDDLESAVARSGGADQLFAGKTPDSVTQFEIRIEYKRSESAATEYRLEVSFDELGRAYASREYLRLKRAPGPGRRRVFLDVKDGEGYAFNEKGERREAFTARDKGTLALKGLGFLQDQPEIAAFREYIQNWTFLAADPAKMRVPAQDRRVIALDREAADIGPVLRSLERARPDALEWIADDLRLFIPSLSSISPQSGHGGLVHVMTEEAGLSRPLPISLQSDGFLFALAIVTALQTAPDQNLIVIEEPEHGLHPQALPTLVELLRAATENHQVLFTTHSPRLVDYLKPEEVVTVMKSNGRTSLNRLSRDQLSQWLDEYTLGELWERQALGGLDWSASDL